MPGVAVALVLTADEAVSRRVGEALFPEADQRALTRAELRPAAPFTGLLFALLAAQSRGSSVGLVVPVVWRGPTGGAGTSAPEQPGPSDLFAICDHVNLKLGGPLSGRWPPGVPRDFPSLTGIYQPAVVRARGGARVYSSGVVAAGVSGVPELSPFEARAVREAGFLAVSDTLVPAAIVAAYYGLKLAACGVAWAPAADRE